MTSACSISREKEATKSTTTIVDRDITGMIETSEQELLSYFKIQKKLLSALAEECLKVENSDGDIYAVQTYVSEKRVALFTNEGVKALDFNAHKKLEQLLSALKAESSPIHIISTASDTPFFSGRTCTFGHTLYIDDQPYFHFELVYCESASAMIGCPEITKQVEPNWYIIGYNYE